MAPALLFNTLHAKRPRHLWSLLLFSILLFAIPVANAESSNPYKIRLLEQARTKKLAEDPVWLRLLHYGEHIFSGYKSIADDPNFFLSERGGRDPQGELETFIASLFRSEPADQASRCLFPARYLWLQSHLPIDTHQLPAFSCPALESWFAALDPSGIDLIYAASYLNNPASSFGHTLLRINSNESSSVTPLIAYAANYSATTAGEPGLVYALKGIFGGYGGLFGITPYYIHLRKYSEIEDRDIWEYSLNLTKPQVEFLTLHLWELRTTNFDYYFFDENCSYQLLSLLETVVPELSATEGFRFWAIPTDTIRAVVEVPGLVKNAHYRPAAGTVLRAAAEGLSAHEQKLAEEIARQRLDYSAPALERLTSERRAAVLEVAALMVQYRDSRNEELVFQLLSARSKFSSGSVLPTPSPPHVRPDQGHKSSRIQIGAALYANDPELQLNIRPALHDLSDPQAGNPLGSKIAVFETEIALREDAQLKLREFWAFNVNSFSPWSAAIRPLSWGMRLGIRESRPEENKDFHIGEFKLAAGTTRLLTDKILAAATLELTANSGPELEENYSLGLGPGLLLQADINEDLRLLLSGSGTGRLLGAEYSDFLLQAELRYMLRDDLAVNFSSAFSKEESFKRWEHGLMLSIFY